MNKRWRKVLIYVFLPIIIIIGLFCFGFWLNTQAIIAVANQFKPDSSWKFEGEHLTPSQPCIAGSGPCPSISRAWATGTFVGSEALQKIAAKNGWNNMRLEDQNCDEGRKDGDGNNVAICSVHGIIKGYDVSISSFSYENIRHIPIVSIYITQADD